ncbi:MAG: acyl carrier protein [Thermoanaerobaculia bacterium]
MKDDPMIGQLREILRDNATEERDWDAIDAETTFESIGIDSLSILDLLYDVEQEFGVHLEGADVIDVRTMGEFVALVKERGG